jgi:hypothetical protein
MTVDLGRVGIWSRELRYNPDRGARAAAAAELEDLGYAAIFIPDAGGATCWVPLSTCWPRPGGCCSRPEC